MLSDLAVRNPWPHTASTFPAAPHVAARPDETRQLSSIRKYADIRVGTVLKISVRCRSKRCVGADRPRMENVAFLRGDSMNVYTRTDRIKR